MIPRLRIALLDTLDERVLPVLLGALGVLVVGHRYARAITMGAPNRGALDFALWWVWFASGALALYLGSRCLAVPLSRRSARFLLAGPLHPGRWGLERLAVTAAIVAGSATSLAIAAAALTRTVPIAWTIALLAETTLLVVFAGAMGALFRPLPALGLAAAIWWIGHLAGPAVAILVERGHGWAGPLLPFLPDLDTLDFHRQTLEGRPVPVRRVVLGLLWASAWTGAGLAATVSLLTHRDL